MATSTAQIMAFPAAARASDIRDAALTIKCLRTSEAETWWKHRARSMADSLLASGLNASIVTSEIEAFQRAVFFELARLHEDD
jgi:hypothetical protein